MVADESRGDPEEESDSEDGSTLPYPWGEDHHPDVYSGWPSDGMPSAAWLWDTHETVAGFGHDEDSNLPDVTKPVTFSPADRRLHFVDIAPTGGGKTTMQEVRAVTDHFASRGPSFYFCGPGRQKVPEDVIAAMLSMPDIDKDDIRDHIAVIPVGQIIPGLTFADLRKYSEAVRERRSRRGFEIGADTARRRAIGNLRDHFTEYIRVAAQDPPEEEHRRPMYQLLHLVPELAFDSDWRDLTIVPPRDQYEVCPVGDFMTIMDRVDRYVRTQQFDKLPVGDLDLKAANEHLRNLMGYSDEVFGNVVSGAGTALMSVRKQPDIQQMLDNTTSQFSMKKLIKTEKLYVIDTSALPRSSQSLATLTLLNELHLATQQLAHKLATLPDVFVINVLLDEAPRMLAFEPVQRWMAEARNNRIGLDLTLQTEQQYREEGQEHLIAEQRTNFGTILARSPNPDDDLAQMFVREDRDQEETLRRLRNIHKYTRLWLTERYRGDPGREIRQAPEMLSYYSIEPPAWRDDSPWRTGRKTGPNPWADLLPADRDDGAHIAPDDPYPFAEADHETAVEDVMRRSQEQFGLSKADRRALRSEGQWVVPPVLQEQYGLEPEAIATAVAIATEHERRTGRFVQESIATGKTVDPTADRDDEIGGTREWMGQARVIARLQYWQALGQPAMEVGMDDDGDEDSGADGDRLSTYSYPESAADWATVFETVPDVIRRDVPPDEVPWPDDTVRATDGGVVALTEDGKRRVETVDTPGAGLKAGGDTHTRLLRRGLLPFRYHNHGFEGGIVTQQPGAPQPDARAFRPGLPELQLEAEYETLKHGAKLGQDLAQIQANGALPVFLVPMVGPDGDQSRRATFWAERVWNHLVTPVRTRSADAVEYYVHRTETIDTESGATGGGWTAARPVGAAPADTDLETVPPAGESSTEVVGNAAAAGADPDVDAENAGEADADAENAGEADADAENAGEAEADAENAGEADAGDDDGEGAEGETDPEAETGDEDGTAEADAEQGGGAESDPAPVDASDPRRETRWVHDGDAYVLEDGTGREYARLNGLTSPTLARFGARYRNQTAGNDDEPDVYEVQTLDEGSWTTYDTYGSTDAMTNVFAPVKAPFVPEADLPHPPGPENAVVLLVDADPDTAPDAATVKWYDGRQRDTDADVVRSIPELLGALTTGDLAPAAGDWSTRTAPRDLSAGARAGEDTLGEGSLFELEADVEAEGKAESASESASQPDAEAAADTAIDTKATDSPQVTRDDFATQVEMAEMDDREPAETDDAVAAVTAEIKAQQERVDALPAPDSGDERVETVGPNDVRPELEPEEAEQQQLREYAERYREQEPTPLPPHVQVLDDRVADSIDPAYEIRPAVVVAVFANTSLDIYPPEEPEGEREIVPQQRRTIRHIYDNWFEPFVDQLPVAVDPPIPYTTFRETVADLFPDVEIIELERADDIFEGAELAKNRPDPDAVAKHLGVAAYVDDAVSVEFDARAAFPVAFEQCTAFAHALGLVPDAHLNADKQVYEPRNFEPIVEWYVGHLVYPGAPDTAPTETDRVRNHTLTDQYTDDQGRAYCWDHLQLTATSTAVPDAPPPQPDT